MEAYGDAHGTEYEAVTIFEEAHGDWSALITKHIRLPR